MGPDTIKEIASHPEEPTILAYDESGNRRMPTPVAIGDEIDWKHDGTRGVMRVYSNTSTTLRPAEDKQ
jgi:hypothetical protein